PQLGGALVGEVAGAVGYDADHNKTPFRRPGPGMDVASCVPLLYRRAKERSSRRTLPGQVVYSTSPGHRMGYHTTEEEGWNSMRRGGIRWALVLRRCGAFFLATLGAALLLSGAGGQASGALRALGD